MKFILPPMTPNEAATSVLNTCMHAFHNKQSWDEPRVVLLSIMQDMFELGYKQAKNEAPFVAPGNTEVIENKTVDIKP